MLTPVRAACLAAWLLALLLGAALILAPPASAQSPPTVDYDDDDDGLIDIRSLAQLNAIRDDRNGNGDATTSAYASAFPNRVTSSSGRMGCPTTGGCTGYELRADLTFDENGDGRMTSAGDPTYWNGGAGWAPINASFTEPWDATFRGNGHTISYLRINRSSQEHAGLFGYTSPGSTVESVGLPHANVTGLHFVGILAGNPRGAITKVFTTGSVTCVGPCGGLAGRSRGAVKASWSTATVYGSASAANAPSGGLIGRNGGSVAASWSAGRVIGMQKGGLVGVNDSGASIANSYWDTGTSGQSASASGSTGKTTRQLQRPAAYGSSGIYANWNLNLDGQTGGDDPWDFGTSRQYPALKFAGRTTYRGPAFIEADYWNAPVVGEPLVAGLYSKTSRSAVSPSATITTCDGVTGTTSRQAWTWQRSDDGRTSWATVTSTNGPSCSYVYVPASADIGKYLRATVPRTSGGAATTLHTAPVVSESMATGTSATFSSGNASPVVGTAVTVSGLPTHSDRTPWRWQRCTSNFGTGCTLLAPGDPSWSYTPVSGDVSGYLRAFVYYSDASGTWTRAETPFTGAVASN